MRCRSGQVRWGTKMKTKLLTDRAPGSRQYHKLCSEGLEFHGATEL
jgi:hypothetical protein